MKNIETMYKSESLYESNGKKTLTRKKRKKETDESHKDNIIFFYKYAMGDTENILWGIENVKQLK